MSSPNRPLSRYADVNGQRLHYKVWSDQGPPLLLLHGITNSAAVWEDIAPEFADRYRVMALDLRGHGESSKPPRGYAWANDYAADVVEFVEDHVAGPVILLGHSLGAMIAPAVAVSLPDRVRAIVMVDPPAFGPTEDPQSTRDRFKPVFALRQMPHELLVERFVERAGLSPARAEQRAKELKTTSLEALRELIEGVTAYKPEDWFPRVTCPALVIAGNPERGGVLSFDDLPRLERLLRGATVVDWGDVGHSIHIEQPERLVEEVRSFFEALPGTG